MYMLWTECLGPPWNSYVEIITPSMMALGGRAFGSQLGHEGAAIMNGISLLIGRDRKELLLLHNTQSLSLSFSVRGCWSHHGIWS